MFIVRDYVLFISGCDPKERFFFCSHDSESECISFGLELCTYILIIIIIGKVVITILFPSLISICGYWKRRLFFQLAKLVTRCQKTRAHFSSYSGKQRFRNRDIVIDHLNMNLHMCIFFFQRCTFESRINHLFHRIYCCHIDKMLSGPGQPHGGLSQSLIVF